MKISKAVASSVCNGIADDALKDEDNGFWLASLPTYVQTVWQQRFYWIRWVDRLAEQDQIVQPGGEQFPMLYQAWKRLYHQRFLSSGDQHWKILRQIETTWFLEDAHELHQAEIEAWNCYMDAIADYHQPELTIATLQDYETMLDRLAGACFQLLPFLKAHHRLVARRFGIVDQFYNNLRDLYEDAQQGVCYFPTDLLHQFGLNRQSILDLSCLKEPGFQPLMKYWVESYLPQLRQQNMSLMLAADLHPAWQCLTTWFVHRYMRIEQVLRACQYDFVAFANRYWTVVQQDLDQQLAKVKQVTLTGRPYIPIDVAEIAPFLNVSPTVLGISRYPHGPAISESVF
ncbi:squalene/phytoene synthase family protein [Oscillatoria sp. CS-180]|uniref:squalene/phytoene synthase family protein n=1 Tax=Oscillatoria sp. CS-180 TaxID=3021720 RepID=UPI00232BA5CD|nr:squalene/phytoene synthase family protein [Oscillatoria sp. CS-180]MDB9528438.1 squalene/phytoene synthase family protein [Oscillatoria sp. CS-180]